MGSLSLIRVAIFVILLRIYAATVVDENFFQSARLGDLKTLQEYISNGVSVHARDSKGNTPIIIASGRGQINVITWLLEKGASVNDFTASGLFEGKTALCWAASQGRTQAAALLIQSGADPNYQSGKGVFQGKTALMWASSQGRSNVVRLLLSVGVDVNFAPKVGNFQGKTSLMWASSQGRVDTVKVLLQAGASVNAKDVDGITALMWASGSEAAEEAHKKGLQFLQKAIKGQRDVVQLLLEYGAQPDSRDNDGITALMYACYHGHTGAVEVLLNWGSHVGYRNKAGLTAYQLALNAGFEETAAMIAHGPTIMNISIVEAMKLPTCGWVLSILRGPRGYGVCPYHSLTQSSVMISSSSTTTTNMITPSSLSTTENRGRDQLQGNTGNPSSISSSTTTNNNSPLNPECVISDPTSLSNYDERCAPITTTTTTTTTTPTTATTTTYNNNINTASTSSTSSSSYSNSNTNNINNSPYPLDTTSSNMSGKNKKYLTLPPIIHTIESSCHILRMNGLDYTLEDIFYLLYHSTSTGITSLDEMITHMGFTTYASKLRAKIQLQQLYEKYVTYIKSLDSII